MPRAATSRAPLPASPSPAAAQPSWLKPRCAYAMLSDRGQVRHGNEDACGARPERGAFAVCDGMGGMAGGEIASQLALETFLQSLADRAAGRPNPARRFPPLAAFHSPQAAFHSPPDGPSRRPPGPDAGPAAGPAAGPDAGVGREAGLKQDLPGEASSSHIRVSLEEAVRAANHVVYRRAQRTRELRGMGTTLVALLLEEACPSPQEPAGAARSGASRVWLTHVGDSRCYRLRSGRLELLTQDHSLVEEQIQAGLLSRVQAGSSPVRNIITRAVGSMFAVEPEIAALDAQSGDLYLLASDGLTRELGEEEIAQVLRGAAVPEGPIAPRSHRRAESTSSGGQAEDTGLLAACRGLVDAANAQGGGDNITVLLVRIP